MSRRAARLEVVAGKAVGMSLPIEDELLLGREFEGPGKLADDDEISRRHARISFADAGGEITVEDLGSTNGTFVNGTRIAEPRALTVGDRIELGSTTLVVRELQGRGEDTVTRETAAPGTPFQPAAVQGFAQPSTASLVISPAGLGPKEETASDEPQPSLGGDEIAEQRTSDDAFDSPVGDDEIAEQRTSDDVSDSPVGDDEIAEQRTSDDVAGSLVGGDEIADQPTSVVLPDSPLVGSQAPAEELPFPAPEPPVADAQIESPRASIAAPGPLRLELEVDFTTRTAKVTAEAGDQSMALAFEDGVWRLRDQSR